MALGVFATVASELVRTGAELVSRIWIEQAKGVLAASQEVTPDEGFQQFRARARSSSSRKLADLVREVVVQEAQRERVAALAMDDARGRVAEARAQAAEQALQAGPNRGAGPTYRGPGPSPRRPGRTGASRRPGRLAGVGAGEVVWVDPSAAAAAQRHRRRGRAHGDLAGAVL
jgi:hypothetical protein